MPLFTIEAWLPAAVVAAGVVVWIYRQVRDSQMNRAFVRTMATNHLPHIYRCLAAIAEKLEIPLGETPLIQFVEFEKKQRSQYDV